jgi:hypothetical protein
MMNYLHLVCPMIWQLNFYTDSQTNQDVIFDINGNKHKGRLFNDKAHVEDLKYTPADYKIKVLDLHGNVLNIKLKRHDDEFFPEYNIKMIAPLKG